MGLRFWRSPTDIGELRGLWNRPLVGFEGLVWGMGECSYVVYSQLGQQEISKMVRWVFDLKPGRLGPGGSWRDGVLKTVDEATFGLLSWKPSTPMEKETGVDPLQ